MKNKKNINQGHLIPKFLTRNGSDICNIILMSDDLNREMTMMETILKNIICYQSVYYQVTAFINKDKYLIIKAEIFNINKKNIYKRKFIDKRKYVFNDLSFKVKNTPPHLL